MSDLLHISSSPRGSASQSLTLATEFTNAYRDAHPTGTVTHWDLWDGTLPEFGPAAAHAKMATIAGEPLTSHQDVAYRRVTETFTRFNAANRYLFSVPMWNATIPYILKQFIDVVSQPGLAFGFDPDTGYTGLLRDKKAVILSTSAVYAPGRPPAFGSDFQQPYLENWLRWIGIDDITLIRMPAPVPGLDHDATQREVRDAITDAATTF